MGKRNHRLVEDQFPRAVLGSQLVVDVEALSEEVSAANGVGELCVHSRPLATTFSTALFQEFYSDIYHYV